MSRVTFKKRRSMKAEVLALLTSPMEKSSPLSDVYIPIVGRYDLESARCPDDGASKCDEGKPSHFLQALVCTNNLPGATRKAAVVVAEVFVEDQLLLVENDGSLLTTCAHSNRFDGRCRGVGEELAGRVRKGRSSERCVGPCSNSPST